MHSRTILTGLTTLALCASLVVQLPAAVAAEATTTLSDAIEASLLSLPEVGAEIGETTVVPPGLAASSVAPDVELPVLIGRPAHPTLTPPATLEESRLLDALTGEGGIDVDSLDSLARHEVLSVPGLLPAAHRGATDGEIQQHFAGIDLETGEGRDPEPPEVDAPAAPMPGSDEPRSTEQASSDAAMAVPMAGVTYRLCGRSVQLDRCSLDVPLGTPVLLDVTGDLLQRFDVVGVLLPYSLPTGEVSVRLIVQRLASSERAGQPLHADVYAEYAPQGETFALGFNGTYASEEMTNSLADRSDAIFGLNVAAAALEGTLDVSATVAFGAPRDATGLIVGVVSDPGMDFAVGVASFSPVPASLTADVLARRRGGASDVAITTTTDRLSRLELSAQSVDSTASPSRARFTGLAVDELPTATEVSVHQPADRELTQLRTVTNRRVGSVGLFDIETAAGATQRGVIASATDLPTSTLLEAETVGAVNTVAYGGDGRAGRYGLLYSDVDADQSTASVVLDDVPSAVSFRFDSTARTVDVAAPERIGTTTATFSRAGALVLDGGDGDHATVNFPGDGFAASARVTGLTGLSVDYAGPYGTILTTQPGGAPLTLRAARDGRAFAEAQLSNLPSRLDLTVDPAAGSAVLRNSAPITQAEITYVDHQSGPHLVAIGTQIPKEMDLNWRLDGPYELAVDGTTGLEAFLGFIAPSYQSEFDPYLHDHVHMFVDDLPAAFTATFAPDTRRATWQASGATGGVAATARVPLGGERWSFTADIDQVPASFTAHYEQSGRVAFQPAAGASVGSVALTASNHGEITMPAAQHVRVRADQVSGLFDGSIQINNVGPVELAWSDGRIRADIQATGGDPVLVHGDLTTADSGSPQDRFLVHGTVTGLPNTIDVTYGNTIDITTTHPINLQLAGAAGRVAAVNEVATAVPTVGHGIGVTDAVCTGGPGCTIDTSSPWCADPTGCGAIGASLNLSGLPLQIQVDPATRTVGFQAYDPPADLLELAIDTSYFTPFPITAYARMEGIPAALTATVGPLDIERTPDDQLDHIDIGYNGTASIGSLYVIGETVQSGDTIRGQAIILPLPADLRVQVDIGTPTRASVQASEPIDRLTVTAGFPFAGRDIVGGFDLTDVPDTMDLTIDGLRNPGAIGLPTHQYSASDSTLDGFAFVGVDYVERVRADLNALGTDLEAEIAVDDVYLGFDNLGAEASLTIDSASKEVSVRSDPTTDRLYAGANAALEVQRQRIDRTLLAEYAAGFADVLLEGHYELRPSSIGDIFFEVRDLSELRIVMGEDGLAFGIDGLYESATLNLDDVDLNPDIDVRLWVDREVGPDAADISLQLQDEHVDSVVLHKSDQQLRQIAQLQAEDSITGTDLFCIHVNAIPGPVAQATNTMTFFGSDGQQTFNYLDPGGDVPDWMLDLLTAYYSHPFPSEVDYEFFGDPGTCG